MMIQALVLVYASLVGGLASEAEKYSNGSFIPIYNLRFICTRMPPPLIAFDDALGKEFRAILRHDYGMFAKNATRLFSGDDGTANSSVNDNESFNKGHLLDNPSACISSIHHGFLDGSIKTRDQEYVIELARKFFMDPVDFEAVLYRASDLVLRPDVIDDVDNQLDITDSPEQQKLIQLLNISDDELSHNETNRTDQRKGAQLINGSKDELGTSNLANQRNILQLLNSSNNGIGVYLLNFTDRKHTHQSIIDSNSEDALDGHNSNLSHYKIPLQRISGIATGIEDRKSNFTDSQDVLQLLHSSNGTLNGIDINLTDESGAIRLRINLEDEFGGRAFNHTDRISPSIRLHNRSADGTIPPNLKLKDKDNVVSTLQSSFKDEFSSKISNSFDYQKVDQLKNISEYKAAAINAFNSNSNYKGLQFVNMSEADFENRAWNSTEQQNTLHSLSISEDMLHNNVLNSSDQDSPIFHSQYPNITNSHHRTPNSSPLTSKMGHSVAVKISKVPRSTYEEHPGHLVQPTEPAALPCVKREKRELANKMEVTPDPPLNKYCTLKLVLDDAFYNFVKFDIGSAMLELHYRLAEVNNVFKRTDFDGDGHADGIGFKVYEMNVFETNNSVNNPFVNFTDPEATDAASRFLYRAAQMQFDHVCAGLVLTYRPFLDDYEPRGQAFQGGDGGPPNLLPRGGICSGKNLTAATNVAFVTLLGGDGLESSRMDFILDVVHQMGHLFGAHHDDSDPSGLFIVKGNNEQDDNSPTLGDPQFRFSDSSARHIHDFLSSHSGSCLKQCTANECRQSFLGSEQDEYLAYQVSETILANAIPAEVPIIKAKTETQDIGTGTTIEEVKALNGKLELTKLGDSPVKLVEDRGSHTLTERHPDDNTTASNLFEDVLTGRLQDITEDDNHKSKSSDAPNKTTEANHHTAIESTPERTRKKNDSHNISEEALVHPEARNASEEALVGFNQTSNLDHYSVPLESIERSELDSSKIILTVDTVAPNASHVVGEAAIGGRHRAYNDLKNQILKRQVCLSSRCVENTPRYSAECSPRQKFVCRTTPCHPPAERCWSGAQTTRPLSIFLVMVLLQFGMTRLLGLFQLCN